MLFSVEYPICHDSIDSLVAEYFGGFGKLYYTGYAIGTFCLIGFALGVLIYLQDDEALLAEMREAQKKSESKQSEALGEKNEVFDES